MMLIQPSSDMSAKIRQELREPESMDAIEKDVLAIREWLARQPHLPKDMGELHFYTMVKPGDSFITASLFIIMKQTTRD